MSGLRRSARVASNPTPSFAESDSEDHSDSSFEEPVPKKIKSVESEPATPELEVGDSIPDLTLLDQDENEVNLVEVAKKSKYLIIFAYPKASTPGCTRQACGFQANYDFLKSSGATVFGLSADQPKAQKNFVIKQNLEYPLLSDPARKLVGVLGAKKAPSGIKRSHWIFVDGVLKVKKIQISPEASISTAKEDVEEFLKSDESAETKEPIVKEATETTEAPNPVAPIETATSAETNEVKAE